MWAPADLFVGGLTPFLVAGRRFATFFYERPVVLFGTLVLVGAALFLVESVSAALAAWAARRRRQPNRGP